MIQPLTPAQVKEWATVEFMQRISAELDKIGFADSQTLLSLLRIAKESFGAGYEAGLNAHNVKKN